MSTDTLSKLSSKTVGHHFLDYAQTHQFGELHFKLDPKSGMIAIVAIHSTKLGPALGGCRYIEYPNIDSAIQDAMRLARGMSFKSALANLPLGGGKAVIIKPSHTHDRDAYFHCFAEFVNDLGGRYVTALDSGTQLSDMDIIAQHTPFIASASQQNGDPSPSTAKGVFRGIQAAVLFKLNKEQLNGLHVAIQGLGHVGYLLAKHLHEAGARLTVADINPNQVNRVVSEFGATVVTTKDIHKVDCDVFSPCALGAIINDTSINELQTTIIAGAANNQLAHTYHGQHLHDRGILYTPDYVINAGGVIFAAGKYLKHSDIQAQEQVDNIKNVLLEIFHRSAQENRPPSEIADTIASEKLA